MSPEFLESCDRLAALTEQSQGLAIMLPSGQQRAFRLTWEYDDYEIAGFENDWELDFPASYRHFLLTVGTAELWYGGGAKGISIHRLDDLIDMYQDFFDEPVPDIFQEWLPIGCLYGTQQVILLKPEDPSGVLALSRLDEGPEEWELQAKSGRTFESFLIEYARSEGAYGS